MTNEEYQAHLMSVATDVRNQTLTKLPEIVALLIIDQDNSLVRDACVQMRLATKAEFARELTRKRQRDVLGIAPNNAQQLLSAFISKHNVKAHYNGMLSREVVPHRVNPDGSITYITREDRARDPLIDEYAAFHFDAKAEMSRRDLELELRILRDNLDLGFNDNSISDAVEVWTQEARRKRLYEISGLISDCDKTFDSESKWLALANGVFDCSDTSPEFVAAVLKKFMWQVKRKMRNMEIYDHLMPVLLGPQGVGKSTFVYKMLGPVDELRLNVDFKMITDDRNIEIWSSYVMFVDEMAGASKTDVNTVKTTVTAPVLTRRPMNSNSKVTIKQNATFIGASNNELGQLVKDPTGNRRFVGIRMKANPDRELINGIDWPKMWGSVDIHAADPMADFRAMLAGQQEEARELSRVEKWMRDFDGTSNIYHSSVNRNNRIPAAKLYLVFSEYEDDFYPGSYKEPKSNWEHEMNRIMKNSPDAMIFEKFRDANGIVYRWKDAQPKPLRVVEGL